MTFVTYDLLKGFVAAFDHDAFVLKSHNLENAVLQAH